MDEITKSIELEKLHSSSWFSLLQTPGNRKRMRIVCAIAFFSQWSGSVSLSPAAQTPSVLTRYLGVTQ